MVAPVFVLLAALALHDGAAATAPPPGPLDAELAEQIRKGDAAAALRVAERVLAVREQEKGARTLALSQALDGLADQLAELDSAAAQAWAVRQLERSLAIQHERQGAEHPAQAATLERLSNVYFVQGNWEGAEKWDRRLLDIRRRSLPSTHPDLAEATRNVGLSLFRQARLAEARPFLEEAVSILERAQPAQPRELAAYLGDLAEALRAQNRHAEAEPMFLRALGLVESAAGPKDRALVPLLTNLSGLFRDQNRYAEAHWRTRLALEIEESSAQPRRSRLITLWNNLAELLRLEGDPRGAETLYLKAIDESRAVLGPDHPRLGTYLTQLAVLYTDTGRHREAETFYRSALDLRTRALGPRHPDLAYTHEGLARLLLASARPREAESAFLQALQIREHTLGARHPEVATALLGLAEAEEAKGGPRSRLRAHLDRALRILEATPAEGRARMKALAFRARIRDAAGDRAGAMTDLSRALDTVELLRPESGGGEQTRSRFMAESLDAFHRMIEWKVQAHDVAGAVAVAERARARALLDQIATAGVDLRAGIPTDIRARLEQREAETRARIAELEERLRISAATRAGTRAHRELQDRLAEAQAEFARLYEETKNASPRWRLAGTSGLASLATLQREVVPARGLMLFYVVGHEASFVFAIPPTGAPEVHRLTVPQDAAKVLDLEPGALTRDLLGRVLAPSANPADAGTSPARGLLERLASAHGGSPAVVERKLHALWRTLVPAALGKHLAAAAEVVVIPDGPLYRLPFEALVVEPSSPQREVRYWLDDGPIVRYAASANSLLALGRARAQPRAAPRLVVSVSDPVYAGESDAGDAAASASSPARPVSLGLERLPGTASEAAAVRDAFGARVLSLERGAAREPAVVAALPQGVFLHLATHGIIDESGGALFATVALTPPPQPTHPSDDGQLQLHEIYELHLDAELAVLSSCESRAGAVVGGEGVFALSRAFLASGARRVIASLWPAEDEATSELMASLFRRLARMESEGGPVDFALALRDARQSIRRQASWRAPFYWAPFVLEGPR